MSIDSTYYVIPDGTYGSDEVTNGYKEEDLYIPVRHIADKLWPFPFPWAWSTEGPHKEYKEEPRHWIRMHKNASQDIYVFDDPTIARARFEEWRKEPCEYIELHIDGVFQPGLGIVEYTREQIVGMMIDREQKNIKSSRRKIKELESYIAACEERISYYVLESEVPLEDEVD